MGKRRRRCYRILPDEGILVVSLAGRSYALRRLNKAQEVQVYRTLVSKEREFKALQSQDDPINCIFDGLEFFVELRLDFLANCCSKIAQDREFILDHANEEELAYAYSRACEFYGVKER